MRSPTSLTRHKHATTTTRMMKLTEIVDETRLYESDATLTLRERYADDDTQRAPLFQWTHRI